MAAVLAAEFAHEIGDASQSLSRALADLEAGTLWHGARGAGVLVALVDSGIDIQATGLEPALVRSVEFVAGDGCLHAIEAPPRDLHGHGTACAGIIQDLAPDARFVSIRVLTGENATSSSARLLAGLYFAKSCAAKIVNLSLGTRRHEAALDLQHAVGRLTALGKICVAACGSGAGREDFPCRFGETIGVDFADVCDPEHLRWRGGDLVPFAARGLQVPVRAPGGGARLVTGSSFAAAHVSGLAARLCGKYEGFTAAEARTVLRALALRCGYKRAEFG